VGIKELIHGNLSWNILWTIVSAQEILVFIIRPEAGFSKKFSHTFHGLSYHHC
jgi:hypothetical protein